MVKFTFTRVAPETVEKRYQSTSVDEPIVAVKLVFNCVDARILAVLDVLFDSNGSAQLVAANVVKFPEVEKVPSVPLQFAWAWNS